MSHTNIGIPLVYPLAPNYMKNALDIYTNNIKNNNETNETETESDESTKPLIN